MEHEQDKESSTPTARDIQASWLASQSEMRHLGLVWLFGTLACFSLLAALGGWLWPPQGWHTQSLWLVMGGAAATSLFLFAALGLLVWKRGHESTAIFVEWLGWLWLSLYLGVCGALYFGGWDSPVVGFFALLILARSVLLPGGLRGFLPPALLLLLMYDVSMWTMAWASLDPSSLIRSVIASHILLFGSIALGCLASWKLALFYQVLSQTDRLGRYQIKERLNRGSMSHVFLAWNRLLDQPCIIKRMPCLSADREEAALEFRREAKVTMKIQHPHVVRILDFGETERDFYLVMEALEGLNLHMLMQLQGPLPLPRVIHLMLQACDGLAAIHRQGILHQDLKPSNLFVAHDPSHPDFLKILDFGISRRREASNKQQAARGHGKNPGTPAYMAPERFLGKSDLPSDIYALGMIFYALLTGRPMFQASSVAAYHELHTHAPVSLSPLLALRPDLPVSLQTILLSSLAKDPQERYPSAPAMYAAFREAQALIGLWTPTDADRAWLSLQEIVLPSAPSTSSSDALPAVSSGSFLPSFPSEAPPTPIAPKELLESPDSRLLDSVPIDPQPLSESPFSKKS